MKSTVTNIRKSNIMANVNNALGKDLNDTNPIDVCTNNTISTNTFYTFKNGYLSRFFNYVVNSVLCKFTSDIIATFTYSETTTNILIPANTTALCLGCKIYRDKDNITCYSLYFANFDAIADVTDLTNDTYRANLIIDARKIFYIEFTESDCLSDFISSEISEKTEKKMNKLVKESNKIYSKFLKRTESEVTKYTAICIISRLVQIISIPLAIIISQCIFSDILPGLIVGTILISISSIVIENLGSISITALEINKLMVPSSKKKKFFRIVKSLS